MDAVLVAIITALATLIGVAMPLGIAAVQGDKKDKRDRQERADLERQHVLQERRKECAALLRMARDFGVAVQNDFEYHGPDKIERAWDIRQRAADITGRADEVSLLVADLSAVADALSDEVHRLAARAVDPKGRVQGASAQPRPPDIGELDQRIQRLKSAAQSVLYGEPATREGSLVSGEVQRELSM